MAVDNERVQVESRAEWRSWRERNHQRSEGIWLVTFKLHLGDRYVSHSEAIDEALRFGWIDSLPRKFDQDRTMLWFAPRKAGSGWSKRNKERVEVLIREGLMTVAGMEKIKAAKKDASWSKLDMVEALEIPTDLQAALDS